MKLRTPLSILQSGYDGVKQSMPYNKLEATSQLAQTTLRSVLGEVAGLMGTLGTLLVLYLIWLSFGPRRNLVSEVRDRKIVPIALLFALPATLFVLILFVGIAVDLLVFSPLERRVLPQLEDMKQACNDLLAY